MSPYNDLQTDLERDLSLDVRKAGFEIKTSKPVQPVAGKRRLLLYGLAALVVLAGALALLWRRGSDPVAATLIQPIRLNCGGWTTDYTEPNGTVWVTDRHFADGGVIYSGSEIIGTAAQPLYRSARYGLWTDFQYFIPVPNGEYRVTLKFAELKHTTPGSRVFNVVLNDKMVLTGFDILAETSPFTPLDKTFVITVTNGALTAAFRGVVDRGIVSGLEIVQLSSASARRPPRGSELGLATFFRFGS